MASSTPIPSSITCFKNGLSHFNFPISFKQGLTPLKIGPLNDSAVLGSISIIPENPKKLKIFSVNSDVNNLLKVHYNLKDGEVEQGNLNYLSPGISWNPNYLIIVHPGDKTLSIEGRATIECEIPFLDDVTIPQLSLVSGAPKIACQGQTDPLVSGSKYFTIGFN